MKKTLLAAAMALSFSAAAEPPISTGGWSVGMNGLSDGLGVTAAFRKKNYRFQTSIPDPAPKPTFRDFREACAHVAHYKFPGVTVNPVATCMPGDRSCAGVDPIAIAEMGHAIPCFGQVYTNAGPQWKYLHGTVSISPVPADECYQLEVHKPLWAAVNILDYTDRRAVVMVDIGNVPTANHIEQTAATAWINDNGLSPLDQEFDVAWDFTDSYVRTGITRWQPIYLEDVLTTVHNPEALSRRVDIGVYKLYPTEREGIYSPQLLRSYCGVWND